MVVNVSHGIKRSISGNDHLTFLFAFDGVNGLVIRPRREINLAGDIDIRILDSDFTQTGGDGGRFVGDVAGTLGKDAGFG